jgi:hypothetical protein
MSWIATGVFLVASAATAYSQVRAADAAEKAAEYNNDLAKEEAKNRELEGHEQIKRERIANRQRLAQIRNRLASSGLLTTSGTPLAILGEAAGNFELGIQDAARASSMQAASLLAQGKMGLWEAEQGKTSAYIGATSTMLSAAGGAASAYYRTKPSSNYTPEGYYSGPGGGAGVTSSGSASRRPY